MMSNTIDEAHISLQKAGSSSIESTCETETTIQNHDHFHVTPADSHKCLLDHIKAGMIAVDLLYKAETECQRLFGGNKRKGHQKCNFLPLVLVPAYVGGPLAQHRVSPCLFSEPSTHPTQPHRARLS